MKPNDKRLTKDRDQFGTVWTSTPDPKSNTNLLDIWSENKDDRFFLRQENNQKVDLIMLDLGQAYDVVRALTEAIEDR